MPTTPDPARVFVWSGGLMEAIGWAFWLGATVWWIDILALSPFQLALMGVFLEASVLLGETPTGVMADLYSRKWSVVLSYALMGVAFIWAVISFNYWVILPAQVLFGVGWTFSSGADVAWVTDELHGARGTSPSQDGESDNLIEPLIMRRQRLSFILGIVALLAMTWLGNWSVRIAMVGTGVAMMTMAAVLSVVMTEQHFTPQREESSFRDTLTQGLRVVRGVPRLRILAVTYFAMELGGEAVDRFGMKRFIDVVKLDQDSFLATGALFIVMAIAGLLVNLVVTRQMEKGRRLPALAATLLTIAAAGVIFSAIGPAAMLIGIGLMFQDATRESAWSVITGWTNRDAPSEVRATIHSLVGQIGAFGEILGAIVLGMVAEWAGIPASLVIAGLLFLLAAGAATRGLRHPPVASATPGS